MTNLIRQSLMKNLLPLVAGFLFFSTGALLAQEKETETGSAECNGPVRLEGGEEEEGTGLPRADTTLLPDLQGSFVRQYNRIGSFDLFLNGIQAVARGSRFRFQAGYDYLNHTGYREHSEEYRHNARIGLETMPTPETELEILGLFTQGRSNMPGSLTLPEYETDPYKADPRSVNRDEKNIFTVGGLDIRFSSRLGRSLSHQLSVRASGELEYRERATREYMIINSFRLGLNADYSWTASWGGHRNIFSVGGDLLMQPERTEYYDNMGGTKGDLIEQLLSEKSSVAGLVVRDTFDILPEKILLGLTGRYVYTEYSVAEMTLPSRVDKRYYHAFTPGITLDYNILKWFSLYGAGCMLYESPAFRQMESPDPFYLYNPDLQPQTSTIVKAGMKTHFSREEEKPWFAETRIGLGFFEGFIDHVIVPYEVYGDIFYRNASSGTRTGIRINGSTEIFTGLDLEFDYSYSKCTYGDYTTISIEEDSSGNVVQVPRDFSGNREPGFPAHDVAVSLSYKHAVARWVSLFARAAYKGSGDFWVDDLNSAKTEFYNVFDLFAGMDLKAGNFMILVSGGLRNLFDEVFVALPTLNSANYRFYNAGAPRNYLLNATITYHF